MERFDERLVVNEPSGSKFYQVVPCEDGKFVLYADAQATVEALQAQLQEGEVAYHKVGEYNDHLKQQVEALRRELEHAKKMEAVQKEVADNQTWHVRELRAALDAEREKVKNTEKAYQEKARLWIEQTGALTQLQALVRAISETMEPFRKSLAKLDEVDTLATRRIAEADAYYCAQRVLAALDATTPAPRQRQLHSCEIPGCVSCANPEEGGDGE